jgi:hypothetical protein
MHQIPLTEWTCVTTNVLQFTSSLCDVGSRAFQNGGKQCFCLRNEMEVESLFLSVKAYILKQQSNLNW